MNILEVLVLGVVQGFTEFIPVSSSGHLVVLHKLFGTTEGSLALDVALHVGTLLALLVYFWSDIFDLIKRLFEGKRRARLPIVIGLASIPAVIAGVILQDIAESSLRSPVIVAINLVIFGVVMLVAERYSRKHSVRNSSIDDVSIKQALAIGGFQALAIVPGVSRSGSTISGGLFFGLDRVLATRFSFLLAIPITIGAVLKLAVDGSFGSLSGDSNMALIGIASSFISGVIAIRFLMGFIAKHGLAWFVYYRFCLAVLIMLVLYYQS